MYAPQAYIAFLSFPSPPLLPPGGSGTQEGCAHLRTPAHTHAHPRCHWPKSSSCAMGTTAARLRLHPWARHGCSSQGQLLFTVVAPRNSLVNGAWRCEWARPWMCFARRRGGRGLGTWEGSRQGWGRADCSSGELELGITSLVQPHQRHPEKPSLGSCLVPLGRSQRLSCSRRVGAALLPWQKGGQKAGRASHNWCICSRQQWRVHSRTVAPQAASARQDGKKM